MPNPRYELDVPEKKAKSSKELEKQILQLQHRIIQLTQRVKTLEILMVRLGE